MKFTLTALMLSLLVTSVPAAAFARNGADDTLEHASSTEAIHGKGDALREEHKEKLEDRAHDRAAQEIERRIEALKKSIERLSEAKRLSDADKSSLTSMLNAQIAELTALGEKIKSDTSTSTLKEDVQSITKSYRIFALVMPKAAILAAADRIKNTASKMEELSAKIKTRLDTLASGGTDVSAQLALLSDMNAKIADAKVQAQAAIDIVTPLTPDNGDEAKKASNLAALKAAKEKIRLGQQDLKTARQDAGQIMSTVKGKGERKGEHAASTTHE